MSESPDIKKARAVVIDDDDGFRILLSRILEEIGHEVYTIANVSPGSVSVIKPSDIVFLDMRMPGLSGFDVIRLLAKDRVECSLILMSGNPNDITEAEGLAHQLGVELLGVLDKPIRMADVLAILEEKPRHLSATGRS